MMTRRDFLKAGVVSGLTALTGCSPLPPFDETEWTRRTSEQDVGLLYAEHYGENGLFFNPWMLRGGGMSLVRALKNRIAENPFNPEFSDANLTNVDNDYSYLNDSYNQSISFVGHATFIIKLAGNTIFTDPFLSDTALVVRKEVKIKFDIDNLPNNLVVLLSHNHYDHLDSDTIKEISAKKNAIYIVPLGLANLMRRYGAIEVYELDWWQSKTIGDVTYTFLPAQHWSRRIGQRDSSTLWGGFMLTGAGKTIYFAGDSGYFVGFKEFGRLYNIDYALVGVGAEEPRNIMHYAHTNPDEFFKAAADLGAKKAIPMHFGVIRLGREPVLYPLYQVYEHLKAHPELVKSTCPLRVGEFTKI
ncbi:hypothetical protein RsTz2092_11920 [Deferribacterales bacterium RsTz2092]|nr:hypothetical protein AGMMS49941_10150 [Deferribacterales bacterium]